MEKYINTFVLDENNILHRHAYCMYNSIQNNPNYKFRIFTLKSKVVQDIINSDETAQKILKFEAPNHKNIFFEYIKLHLMLKFGGVWCEADHLFTMNDNFEFGEFSHLIGCDWKEYRANYHYVSFATWNPIYVNNDNIYIQNYLKKCIINFANINDSDYNSYSFPYEVFFGFIGLFPIDDKFNSILDWNFQLCNESNIKESYICHNAHFPGDFTWINFDVLDYGNDILFSYKLDGNVIEAKGKKVDFSKVNAKLISQVEAFRTKGIKNYVVP